MIWRVPVVGLLAALPLVGVAPLTGSAMADQVENLAQAVPNLTVSGRAELSKPADELRLNIGVVTQHEEAAEAIRRNAQRMNEVIAAIEEAGLDEDEYETGRFQIHPVYTQRPQRQQQTQPFHPEIAAYRVTNSIQVKTGQLELAGTLIDEASRAGANTIDSIQFTLADPRTHRAEAIQTATRNAINDARALAEAAGLRLVRIVSINLDEPPPVRPMRQEMLGRAAAMDMAEEPTPIRPGEVTVRATVNVIYEVAPQE